MSNAARLDDIYICLDLNLDGSPHIRGNIRQGSPNVRVNGLPAARMGDAGACVGQREGAPPVIAGGSRTVMINRRPAARYMDRVSHRGGIARASWNVRVGDSRPASAERSFATQEEAAIAALRHANPRSINDNREYGGLIYRDAAGRYHYTEPEGGDGTSFDPHAVQVPPGSTVVGDYHAHGDYSEEGPNGPVRTSDPARDDYRSDQFSPTDRAGLKVDGAGNPEYRGYLGTPSGTYREYDPNTGWEREIG
jgi:uncharacterized Zn-binding protein involved in type VI secretion